MTREISNTDDVIDSRDVIARIEELEGERDSWVRIDEDGTESSGAGDWAQWLAGDADELAALTALAEEAKGCAVDWKYGETLIRDSYFTDYARETVEDCGYISPELPSWIEIDWDATARNVQRDYTSVDFDGVTYWIR